MGWDCRRTTVENPSPIRNCVNQAWPGAVAYTCNPMRDLGPAHQDRSGMREDPAGQETTAITNPSPSLAADLAGDALPGCLGAAAHQGPLLDRSSESTLSPQALELEHYHVRGCCRGCTSFSPFPAPRCPSEQLGAHSSRWAIRGRSKINPPPWAPACLPGGFPACLPAPKSSTDSAGSCFKGGSEFSDPLDIPGAGAMS
uniref:Uncharacterized protein n=1 Tax=Gorilla gorilla gorilla TaxID=9595 RepID=G3REW6_GORGO